MKILVLGNGPIEQKTINYLENNFFDHIICCGKSIDRCERLSYGYLSMVLTEARLQDETYWSTLDQIRKEKQAYNRQACDINISKADNILMCFTKKLYKCEIELQNHFKRKHGNKVTLNILSNRRLILQWISISDVSALLRALSFKDLLSIAMMFVANSNFKRFGYDWVSSGIKAIIYASQFGASIQTAGISLKTRKIAILNGVKYTYPEKGQTAHLANDIKFFQCLKDQLNIQILN